MSMQFDENTKFLAAGTRYGTINIYNMEYCELDDQINPVNESEILNGDMPISYEYSPVTCLRWKPRSRYSRTAATLTASYSNGIVKFWDINTKESRIKITETEGQGIYSIDYNSTGSSLATGGADYSLRIYDEKTKTLVQTYSKLGCGEVLNHYNRIHCVKFHPEDENVIFSGGAD